MKNAARSSGKKWRGRLSTAFNIAGGMAIAAHLLAPYALLDDGPTALEKRGLDPALAQTLADYHIRVAEENTFAGKAFRFTQFSSLFEPNSSYARQSLPDVVLQRCVVVLRDNEDLPGSIAASTGLNIKDITHIPLDTQTYKNYVLAHEFAHCHSSNNNNPALTAEADADIRALRALLESGFDPEIYRATLYFRALNAFGQSHDTSLALESAITGTPSYSIEEAETAQTILRTIAKRALGNWCREQKPGFDYSVKPDEIDPRHIAMAVNNFLKASPALNAAVKRRLELYLEAVAYYMPEIAASLQANPRPRNLTTICHHTPPAA